MGRVTATDPETHRARAGSTSSSWVFGEALGITWRTTPSVDEERRALSPHVRLAVHRLLTQTPYRSVTAWSSSARSVKFSDCLSWNFLTALTGSGETPRTVAPAASYSARVADAAGLRRAARRVGSGVEVEDDPLAAQVAQRDVVAVLILQREVGCFGPCLDHAPRLFEEPRQPAVPELAARLLLRAGAATCGCAARGRRSARPASARVEHDEHAHRDACGCRRRAAGGAARPARR